MGRAIGRFAGYFGTGTPYTVFGAEGTSCRFGPGWERYGSVPFAAGSLRGRVMIRGLFDALFYAWVVNNLPLLGLAAALFGLAYMLNKRGKVG